MSNLGNSFRHIPPFIPPLASGSLCREPLGLFHGQTATGRWFATFRHPTVLPPPGENCALVYAAELRLCLGADKEPLSPARQRHSPVRFLFAGELRRVSASLLHRIGFGYPRLFLLEAGLAQSVQKMIDVSGVAEQSSQSDRRIGQVRIHRLEIGERSFRFIKPAELSEARNYIA